MVRRSRLGNGAAALTAERKETEGGSSENLAFLKGRSLHVRD